MVSILMTLQQVRKPVTTVFLDDDTKHQLDFIANVLRLFNRTAVIRKMTQEYYLKNYMKETG